MKATFLPNLIKFLLLVALAAAIARRAQQQHERSTNP